MSTTPASGQGQRLVKFVLFVGMNGSGKSHQMKQWLRLNPRNLILPASRADKQWMGVPELKPEVVFRLDRMDPAKKRKRAMFILPGIDDYQGNRVVHIQGSDEERVRTFDAVIHPEWGFHNGGIFMDDAKNYIRTKGNLPGNVRTFWGDRRLHMVDIFMAAWQYQDVNADFFGFGGLQMFIHNVERHPNKSVMEKVPRPEEFIRVHQWVQQVNQYLHPDFRWYFLPFPAIGNARPGTDPRVAALAFARASRQPAHALQHVVDSTRRSMPHPQRQYP